MYSLAKKWPLGILGLSLLSSANVYANDCAQPSPLKVQLGDQYVAQDLGYSSPAKKQQSASTNQHHDKNFITELVDRSFKRGSGVRYVCKGSGDHVRLETTEFTLEDMHWSKSLNGNVALKARESSDRKTTLSSINIAPAPIWNMSNDNAATSVILTRSLNPYLNTTLDFLYSNYLYFNGFVYQPPEYERENLLDFPDRSGYRLTEIRTEVMRSGKGITLRQSVYINGEPAEWVVWDLLS